MPNSTGDPFVIDFKHSNNNINGALTSALSVPSSYGATDDAAMASSSRGAETHPDNKALNTRSSHVYCLHGKSHGKSHIELRDHCHRQRSDGVDAKARKKLIIASVLCLFFMICEIIGGVLSNSLAIATDAAHLLTDFASFMISLFAIWLAGRPSTQRMSFGWYRAEVIGAMASVIMIWVITAILVWLAVQRLIYGDFEVDATIMLITSGLAILVNLIMGLQLQHGHSHSGMVTGHSHSGGGCIEDSKPTGKKKEDSTKTDIEATGLALRPGKVDPMTSQKTTVEDEEMAVTAEMPAAGLRSFSYQNSTSVNEVQAEIAAVMAETAPGSHHHGGKAMKEAVNMNVRAAFIHVVGDMIQSAGVFVAALIIYFRPDWAIVDPICTFIFSIIVLFTTFTIMKDALLVLMEGTPTYMHYTEVLDIFQSIDGVQRVHNLRIWALSINKVALSVHLAVEPGADSAKILDQATKAVHMRYNFFETTIQIEEYTATMENCKQCQLP